MAVRIRVATLADAADLVRDIRPADLAEIRAGIADGAGTQEILAAVEESIAASSEAYTVEDDTGILAVYGTVDHGYAAGVWMLGTNGLRRYRRALLRFPRLYIQNLLRTYDMLFNYVHSENKDSIRWLQALGFTVFPQAGRWPFRRFEMTRS